MKELLPKLTTHLPAYENAYQIPHFSTIAVPKEDSQDISQAWFWPRMGQFFKEKDVIVAETGTSSFGVLDVPLPKDSVFLAQILWGSIGWTVGTLSILPSVRVDSRLIR